MALPGQKAHSCSTRRALNKAPSDNALDPNEGDLLQLPSVDVAKPLIGKQRTAVACPRSTLHDAIIQSAPDNVPQMALERTLQCQQKARRGAEQWLLKSEKICQEAPGER